MVFNALYDRRLFPYIPSFIEAIERRDVAAVTKFNPAVFAGLADSNRQTPGPAHRVGGIFDQVAEYLKNRIAF